MEDVLGPANLNEDFLHNVRLFLHSPAYHDVVVSCLFTRRATTRDADAIFVASSPVACS